jgi:hypothetical protein
LALIIVAPLDLPMLIASTGLFGPRGTVRLFISCRDCSLLACALVSGRLAKRLGDVHEVMLSLFAVVERRVGEAHADICTRDTHVAASCEKHPIIRTVHRCPSSGDVIF